MGIDSYAMGIDVSAYSGVINWEMVKSKINPVFAACRVVLGYAGIDKFMKANLQGATAIGCRVFAYGIFFPELPVKAQADHFIDTVGALVGWEGIIPVPDLELNRQGVSPSALTGRLIEYGDRLIEGVGHGLVDYSRATWIDSNTVRGSWRAKKNWWLAHYLNTRDIEKPPPPAMPVDVTNWLIHQTADKVKPPPGVMEGTTLDVNRWNGGADAVQKFFAENCGEITPPETHNTLLDWAHAVDPLLRDRLGYDGIEPPEG